MTRKDYKLIAEVLKSGMENWAGWNEKPEEVLSGTARSLATKLAQDNPRFDRAKFLEACGVK
jgi:hypothetical protein